MENCQKNLLHLLQKVADDPPEAEVVYANNRLIEDLFETLFGGVTRLIESIEQTSDKALKAESRAGFGGALAALFLDLKACVKTEGKIGKHTKTYLEKELTLQKKIRLCEACLDMQNRIRNNPASPTQAKDKYLKLINCLTTFPMPDDESLTESVGFEAAETIRHRWRIDQALTPNSPQIALVMPSPFCAAAIVKVQPETAGSTYIAYPPAAGKREVVATPLTREKGVTFLKTYWMVDIDPHQDLS